MATTKRVAGRDEPVWDILNYWIETPGEMRARQTEATRGIVRASISGPTLSRGAAAFEFQEKAAGSKIYTPTLAEQRALRTAMQDEQPLTFCLHWERERHGPQSPTVENEGVVLNITDQAGATFSVTAPTSGNTLIVSYGYYAMDANVYVPNGTAAGFTNRAVSGSANTHPCMVIMSKVSDGMEGTSIAVTNNGISKRNSGHYQEVSGLTATPFIAGSNANVTPSSGVTSKGSGTSDPGAVADVYFVAAWGFENTGSPTGFGYSNSFAEEGSSLGRAATIDHSTKVATKIISTAAPNSCTMNWTNSAFCGGCIAAFEIAPSVTVPDAPTDLAAVGESPTTVMLSWNQPAHDGGSEILSNTIERESPTGGGFSTLVADTGEPITSFRDTGLTSGVEYNYRIYAINAQGPGAASSAAAAATPGYADNDQLGQIAFALGEEILPRPDGAVLDAADRQHLLGVSRSPLFDTPGGALIAQQQIWYDHAGAL
ncbi:MAG: fibronectin type III domain-containing protein [Nitrospirales bacterium]